MKENRKKDLVLSIYAVQRRIGISYEEAYRRFMSGDIFVSHYRTHTPLHPSDYSEFGTSRAEDVVNRELAKQVIIANGMLEERNNELEDCHEKMEELAWFLIGKAAAYDDTDLYNEAIRIVGRKAAVLQKVKMGYPLWKEDREYIKNNQK